MSTPIKPPGGPSAPEGPESPEGSSIDPTDGGFGDLVEDAKSGAAKVSTEAAGPLRALGQDLVAGRSTVDDAVEQIVQRALDGASGLSEDHRAALESQLRDALDGDPTLAALRKDLQRAASKG